MLDEYPEEPLDGAEQCPMHHQRLMRLAVLGDVLQAELARQSEVELDGRKLPQPANGVDQLDVDLGTVERRLVGYYLHVQVEPRNGFGERVLRKSPLLRSTVVLAAR